MASSALIQDRTRTGAGPGSTSSRPCDGRERYSFAARSGSAMIRTFLARARAMFRPVLHDPLDPATPAVGRGPDSGGAFSQEIYHRPPAALGPP
jgi:hypothetical protein